MQDHRVFFCLYPKFSIHRRFPSLPQKLDGGGGRTQVHRLPFLSIRLIMPMLHVCAYPGCQEAIPLSDKYCARHKEKGKEQAAEREARRKRFKGSSAERGYGSKWRKRRAAFLKEHPLCEECLKRGLLVKATDVDHIIPHRGNQKLMWDQNNWQALCHACHSRKTASEDGGFGNSMF